MRYGRGNRMDNEILISTKIDVDYSKAEKELEALQKRIDKLKEQQTVRIKLVDDSLSERRYGIYQQLEKEKKVLGDMSLWRDGQEAIDAQKEKVKGLQKEFNRLDGAVNRYNEAIIKGDVELGNLEQKAKEMATALSSKQPAQAQEEHAKAIDKVGKSAKKMSTHMNQASKSARTFGNRVKGLVKRVLVFSVITMALRHLRSWFMNVIQANDEAAVAFGNLKGSLMTLIQPLMNVIIPLLAKAFNILTKIISFIASIMSTLFGTTLQASAQSAEAMNNSISGTAEGLGSANDEAKKLKRTLASFDEITILENPDEGGGGGASAAATSFDFIKDLDFGGFFDESEWNAIRQVGEKLGEIFGGIWQKIKDIVELVIEWGKDVDFTSLLESIVELLDSVWSILEPIFEIIKTLWQELVAPLLKRAVEDWLPRLIKSTSSIFKIIGRLISVLQPILETIFKILEPILEIVAEIATKTTEMINEHVEAAIEILADALERVAPIIKWIGDLLQPILQLLQPIIELIFELVDVLNDSLLFILKLIIDVITGDFDAAREDFNEYLGDMSEHLNKFKELFEKIGEAFKKVWEAVKNAGLAAWEAIKNAWGAVSGFFSGIWNGIKSGVVGAMNAVIGAIESAINWIIDAINSFISGINDVIYVVGRVFKQNWSGIGYVGYVSLGRIPLLAQGAVVPPNNPFLATLGDNTTETEIVSPLSTIKQALAEALAEANFNGNINVYLDGKQIANSVTKYQMQANRALGV